MDTKDAIVILLRAARKCPEESAGLLMLAEEMAMGRLESGNGSHNPPSRPVSVPASGPGGSFPLPVFIETKGRRIDGMLYADEAIVVDGHKYRSVSDAATEELGYSENGWRKWMFHADDGATRSIDSLRERGLIGGPRGRRR